MIFTVNSQSKEGDNALDFPASDAAAQRAATSKRRRKVLLFSAIALVLFALALLTAFNKLDPVIKDPAMIVQTVKVARHSLTNIIVAKGRIQPIVQVTISPEVSGEIVDLPVKEGQRVKKGDLLVKIGPDVYIATVNQAKANYETTLAAKAYAAVNLEKAEADYQRNLALFNVKLLSQSDFTGFKYARDLAKTQLDSANAQVKVAKAAVDSAEEELAKTTILSPLDGTITRLNSEVGEGVLGTVQNVGTAIMVISDLNEMEARVEIGEMDVVKIAPGQKARLDVNTFKAHKFNGVVTYIANSSDNVSGSGQPQEPTKFQVRIRFNEMADFRSGMSVSAAIETEYRTDVLTVPLTSVVTAPMLAKKNDSQEKGGTNLTASFALGTNSVSDMNNLATPSENKESSKPVNIVFVVGGDHVKAVPVKLGICDDNYWEIIDGLTNGEEIVSDGRRAIDGLQDGAEIRISPELGGKPNMSATSGFAGGR